MNRRQACNCRSTTMVLVRGQESAWGHTRSPWAGPKHHLAASGHPPIADMAKAPALMINPSQEETSSVDELELRPPPCPVLGSQSISVDRQFAQECGARTNYHTDKVLYSMGGNHLHIAAKNPCSNRSRRLGPTANRILSIAIGRISVAFVHTCLIVRRPRNIGEFIE